jgi:hypothetical protein
MTPRFVFYNQNASAASEGAMRTAAHLTGFEEEMGDLATGRIANFLENTIEATLGKPTRATSIGKELTRSDMLPGLNTVSGMQDLGPFLPAQKGTGILPPLGATAEEAAAARTAWGVEPSPEAPLPVAGEQPPLLPPLAAPTPTAAPPRFATRADAQARMTELEEQARTAAAAHPDLKKVTATRTRAQAKYDAAVKANADEATLAAAKKALDSAERSLNLAVTRRAESELHTLLTGLDRDELRQLDAHVRLPERVVPDVWEVPLAQFRARPWDKPGGLLVPEVVLPEPTTRTAEAIDAHRAAQVAATHRANVEEALRRGKDVPPDVLADYPDLAPTQAAASAAPSTAGPSAAAPAPVIPHSDRIQPEVVAQALAMLPEAIRADVTRRVGRIGVKDFGGDGGKFVMGNPGKPGTVFVEPDQIDNVRTIAHELLHAHTIEADFSKDFLTRWAEARYPEGDLAAMKERIAKGQGFHAFGYNGNEDLTVGIERYLFEPEALSDAQRAVLGEYLSPPPSPTIDVARTVPLAQQRLDEATAAMSAARQALMDAIARGDSEAALAPLRAHLDATVTAHEAAFQAAPAAAPIAPAPAPAAAPPSVLPPLADEPIDVAPPDALSSRVLGLHRAGPSPVATAGGQTDIAAVKAAFREAKGHVSPDVVEEIALRHGATAEEAARLRSVWDQEAQAGYQAGLDRANAIHFDYSDVNRLVAGARDTGILPFITWQTKALPKFATLLLQNPRFLIAIDGLNNLSDQDVDEAGLTSRYARLVKLGVLGDVLAQQVLGRAEGTVLGAPLKALFPYGDVGREGTVSEKANPLEQALSQLRPLGVSPGPAVSLPLMAAGAISELPVDVNPTSRYLRPLSTQLTGREADPELLTRRLMAAARTATGAGAEPTVTGDFLRDRSIRQRIAELAVEETGKPPAGPYLLAMDDPASQIWLRARAQVDRQRMGEAGLGAVLPFRTKFLSDTEVDVRRIRDQTGVGPTDSAARRAQPATAAELLAAEADTRKKPLKLGETLEDRAATKRWIDAENAAAAANPLARTLNSLGGNDALSRQFPEYLALQRRIRHMNPKRRGQMLAEFLGPRKALREYLAANNIYG